MADSERCRKDVPELLIVITGNTTLIYTNENVIGVAEDQSLAHLALADENGYREHR